MVKAHRKWEKITVQGVQCHLAVRLLLYDHSFTIQNKKNFIKSNNPMHLSLSVLLYLHKKMAVRISRVLSFGASKKLRVCLLRYVYTVMWPKDTIFFLIGNQFMIYSGYHCFGSDRSYFGV